ncbi:MAG: putative DNA binding domain-containing protein [Ignavibacteriaceae bacterium]|nr:putative DNA binding domain-containing protein [Ignavibacteriaceae bacterium]
MKLQDILELIEGGETLTCEFKRKFSTQEKIAKEMIAFANTKGGYLLIGVDDDKSVIGVESEKSESELILDVAKNYCEPPLEVKIEYVEIKGKEVVIVQVFESDNKPHRLQDYLSELDINNSVVTIRVKDKSVQASKEMIRLLKAQSSELKLKKYSIGSNEKAVFEYLDKNERISVKELSRFINISERRASRTLVKLVRANLLFIHTKENGEEYFTSRQI